MIKFDVDELTFHIIKVNYLISNGWEYNGNWEKKGFEKEVVHRDKYYIDKNKQTYSDYDKCYYTTDEAYDVQQERNEK